MFYYDREAIKEISLMNLVLTRQKSLLQLICSKNMDIGSISSVLGLSLDEINELKMEIQKEKN